MTAAVGDHAHAQGKLDASYTISFARIRVGDITANFAFGDSEYTISARGHAGGVMKLLVDGEGSFTTHGTIKHGHPVPTTFTSEIVSNAETSDVTMVLDEGSVKEVAATPPPPGWDRVPVTQANRQRIVDPLTAMLFSAAPGGEGLSQDACRYTLPIFDGNHRYDLKKTAFASALTKFGPHMATPTAKPTSIGLQPSGKSATARYGEGRAEAGDRSRQNDPCGCGKRKHG
jgi:hypothetical protein